MARLDHLLYFAVVVKYVLNTLLLAAILLGFYFGMKKNAAVTIIVTVLILLFFGSRNFPRSLARENTSQDNRSEIRKNKIKMRLKNLEAVVGELEKTKRNKRDTNYEERLSFARYMVAKAKLDLDGNLIENKRSLIELRKENVTPRTLQRH